jgi:hypothetical protein
MASLELFVLYLHRVMTALLTLAGGGVEIRRQLAYEDKSIQDEASTFRSGRGCCEQATLRLLLAGSYRFSYTEVAEGSAGQAPGGKEVGKVERTYIDVLFSQGRQQGSCFQPSYVHLFAVRNRGQA